MFDGYCRFGDVASAEGYLLGPAARTRMTRAWNEFLARYPLVLTPFLMRPAYPHDIDSRSYDGLAGVLPIGFVDGMPSAVQLVGRRYREDLVHRCDGGARARHGCAGTATVGARRGAASA